MVRNIETIFENGVFRPLTPVQGVPEHSLIRVTINDVAQPHPLADVIGIMFDEDAKEMRKIIDEEFGKVNFDDWK